MATMTVKLEIEVKVDVSSVERVSENAGVRKATFDDFVHNLEYNFAHSTLPVISTAIVDSTFCVGRGD